MKIPIGSTGQVAIAVLWFVPNQSAPPPDATDNEAENEAFARENFGMVPHELYEHLTRIAALAQRDPQDLRKLVFEISGGDDLLTQRIMQLLETIGMEDGTES